MDNKPLKIMALPVDRGGCGWLRVRQPFEMLNEYTDSEAHVIDKDQDDVIETAEALSNADIIVVRQGGERGVEELRRAVREYGKEIGKPKEITAKIVLDIDDNIELISPYSEHYKEYGLFEYTDPDTGKLIWQNGVHDFEERDNRFRVMSMFRGMYEADLITVTTQKLADYAKQFNPNVAILPNFVSSKKWWKLNRAPNSQLRIGWSGGISHYEDWYSIKEPLNRLMRKYKFKLVMVGSHFDGLIDPDNKSLVEIHPWVPFEAHSYHMMCMEMDAAIIPLADLPFNHYKSSVKFYEMSAMGIPSVVADVLPYSEDASLENSSPYGTPEGFEYALEKLILDESYRNKIAKVAYQESRDKWDATKNAHVWTDAYRKILTGK